MRIIVALLIFSLIIIFHEFGHFLLAKKNGICVLEFSLGLGPTIVGFTKGETKYSLKLLPFGGACMMLGEDEDSDNERAFGNKSIAARMSVVLAGPIFNFILAFIFSVIIIGTIGYDSPVISGVIEGSSAEEVGLKEGDKILKIDNTNVTIYRDISLYTTTHPNAQKVDVVYERDGKSYETTITLKASKEDGRKLMGIAGSIGRVKGDVFTVIKYSFNEVGFWIKLTVASLKMLVTGGVSLNDMSGPVGIVNVIGNTYEQSIMEGLLVTFLNMSNMIILLSANLGVMNLLPIPALDGGRFVFLFIEAIRGKKFDPQKEGLVNTAFFAILMVFMVLIMINDIRKLF
ncbi:regulator of sigma E protease [Acetitomaculum ruminis DSM 5522]|uniref:Zinc metalloprotease n=1 Tax=Acetitomaculum ruminis DSM 5522 TaxID=1120918 RepID=A0A1I1A7E1_9FIRM|nr:RIP metalloprotease RseP [Acetitomaculum ruminis]SFB33895.1 regulator of sigma E protease [Acetitomaculum ruminis DSM 5522]